MKKLLVILLITLPLITLGQRDKVKESSSKPRNVIFIVGDGMGTAQVYTSIVAQRDNNSAFLRFPYVGFSRTYSNNKYTTDSGAGGSALMTGHKVDNYHIAKGPDGTDYPSFLITSSLPRSATARPPDLSSPAVCSMPHPPPPTPMSPTANSSTPSVCRWRSVLSR